MVMILFEHVTKYYPKDTHPALDDVSLHIEPNEFVFLVGKSGAGKSTLIKMITMEEQKTSGKIIVGGIDLDFVKKRYIPHYRRRLGVVFQDFKLLPNRTVYENVSFALEIAGMSNKEIHSTVPVVLDLVGLLNKAHKFPRHLSGGEQQRVSIARSIARQPKILIADEPTGNLDKLTRQEIMDLLGKINDYGTTVLVTTHDEQVVNTLKKRVITMKNGRIIDDQKIGGVYRLDRDGDGIAGIEFRPLNESKNQKNVNDRPKNINSRTNFNTSPLSTTTANAPRNRFIVPPVNRFSASNQPTATRQTINHSGYTTSPARSNIAISNQPEFKSSARPTNRFKLNFKKDRSL